jgi:hypothetical protein
MQSRLVAALVVSAIFGGALLAGQDARADRRIFAYSYPYMTLPEGTMEMEHYLDAKWTSLDDPDTTDVEDDLVVDWKHQVEFEYAITDRLDFGFYNVFKQSAFDSMKYDGPKVRSRYRFGDQGQFLVDPAVYFELAYNGNDVKIEQILIFARQFGKVEAALNLKFEEKFKDAGGANDFVFEFIPSVGVGYHINHNVSIGLEYLAKTEYKEGGEYEFENHYAGPTVSVMGKNFWWTIAFQPQLKFDKEEGALYQARSIFAVVF